MNKMNQTQTRSPRKRLLSLILAVILMIGLLPISAFATSASAQANDAEDTGYKYNIMFLDCGRKYFSVNSISRSSTMRRRLGLTISSWPWATMACASCWTTCP